MSKKKKIFKRPSKNLENQSIPLKKKKKITRLGSKNERNEGQLETFAQHFVH